MKSAAAGLRLIPFALLLALPPAGWAQSDVPAPGVRPDARDGLLFRVDARLGYLITGGQGFSDRPFVQIDGGIQFGQATVGGPPSLALTVGAAVGAGEFLAEAGTYSLRMLGGVELPWAIDASVLGDRPVELVPAIQAGHQESYGEDERSGFTLRAALGLRLLPSSGTFFVTFEPAGFVLLPRPDPAMDEGSSRFAAELGVLKVGWRF